MFSIFIRYFLSRAGGDLLGIYGNVENIKKELMLQLKTLENSTYPKNYIVSPELAQQLALLSSSIGREIAIYLDRHGRSREIMVGDRDTAPLINEHLRRNAERLAGIRCIHTHPSGNSNLSQVDLSSLQEYNLDAMIAIGSREGMVTGISIAFLEPNENTDNTISTSNRIIPNEHNVKMFNLRGIDELERFPFLKILQEIDKKSKKPLLHQTETEEEITLLLGFTEKKGDLLTGEDSLLELLALAQTAGAKIKSKLLLNLNKPDPAFYLGSGKVKDLSLFIQQEAIDLVIFDDELSPRQQNNLNEILGCRVIDRTALILQIFANRAKTREGKLQVELAQLNYLLPRLTGMGTELSRLGGGIGTRGPGETKLETDKRHIRKKIGELQHKIEEIKRQRHILRHKRSRNNVPVVALLGYTNAGKSTLLNTLTGANALAENKLFATLDPTTRRLQLKQGEILLTDTVGFIHKLPHQLVAAFRATLEEIKYADLLLHVVDGANPACLAQIESVNHVLKELDCIEKPVIMVFNKWDLVTDPVEMNNILSQYHPAIPISAEKNYNLTELEELIAGNLPKQPELITLLLPFNQASLLNLLYENGKVLKTEYLAEGILCSAYLSQPLSDSLHEYQLTEKTET